MQRTTQAINYEYRSGPTLIDFRGTVILPHAKGQATVESHQGRTDIDAKIDGLESPQSFGAQYLAYVLWAITPEGSPHNLGELIPNASNKARIQVTTDLQAFALIVTAEPYSAVRQPGNLVVAENHIRPDTLGGIVPVDAKYELLPRGEFTWQGPSGSAPAAGPSVSLHEYEALSEIYQAQNAIAAAAAAKAEQYAPDTLAGARQQLATAEQMHARKDDFRQVVQRARDAQQTAEDALQIAQRRQQDQQLQASAQELSKMQADLLNAEQAKQQALAEAQRARSQAEAASAQADAARAEAKAAQAAGAQAQAEAAAAQQAAAQSEQQAAARTELASREEQLASQRERRMRLIEDLKGALPTLDTSRGLVVTVSGDDFNRAVLRDKTASQVAQVAAIVSGHPGLTLSVQGYCDTPEKDAVARERAETVRRALIDNGIPAASVTAAGFGTDRPVASNATPEGRRENTRVEIVINGDSIGRLPLWERPYPITQLQLP